MDSFKSNARTSALAASALALVACGGGKSSSNGDNGNPVPTSAMEIHMSVDRSYSYSSTSGPIARVVVVLEDARPEQWLPPPSQSPAPSAPPIKPRIELDGGDNLQACVANQCKQMTAHRVAFPNPGGLFYDAELPRIEGTPYRVSLLRPPGRNSAPETSATLPIDSALVFPLDGQQVTDGETITVAWSPVDPAATATVSSWINCTFAPPTGDRLESLTDVVDESRSGSVELSIDAMLAAVLADRPHTPAPQTPVTGCRISLDLYLERAGVVDPAFAPGTAYGWASSPIRQIDYAPNR
jgi:hypothetical protein